MMKRGTYVVLKNCKTIVEIDQSDDSIVIQQTSNNEIKFIKLNDLSERDLRNISELCIDEIHKRNARKIKCAETYDESIKKYFPNTKQ